MYAYNGPLAMAPHLVKVPGYDPLKGYNADRLGGDFNQLVPVRSARPNAKPRPLREALQ
jgi:hypothetical protein